MSEQLTPCDNPYKSDRSADALIEGGWRAECYCGNLSDFREASEYCDSMNTRAAILALKSKEALRD